MASSPAPVMSSVSLNAIARWSTKGTVPYGGGCRRSYGDLGGEPFAMTLQVPDPYEVALDDLPGIQFNLDVLVGLVDAYHLGGNETFAVRVGDGDDLTNLNLHVKSVGPPQTHSPVPAFLRVRAGASGRGGS